MRNIQKGAEPSSLTRHRKTPYADYSNYSDKGALRAHLVNEQCGICCYCMERIRPTAHDMKIEHWQCQENYPNRQLDYKNMLGACLGGEGRPSREQHCDTRKGEADLSINPADPACDVERLIKFPGNGKITSDNLDIDRQLNEVLNLNHPQLVDNRRSVIDSLCRAFGSGRKKKDQHALLRDLSYWRGEEGGELHEYSGVVVYYLLKKLKVVS